LFPYWFAALTMKTVGKAAGEKVAEVKRQFSIKDRSMSRVQATVRCHDATMFL
jgi:Na+/H+-translocating membrane pyrophosphatase